MNNSDPPEIKRRDFRAETAYPFWFRKLEEMKNGTDRGGKWRHSYTLNLSAGGALIFTDDDGLKEEDLVEFELVVPGGPVFGIARVVRTILDERQQKQCGVMFVSIASRDKDRIAQVVLNDGLEKRYDEFR